MNRPRFVPPPFFQRVAAAWVDFVFLLGSYLILGSLSEHLFHRDAFPPAQSMQLYSERDFAVFQFFAVSTLGLTIAYLLLCYYFLGATLGQLLARIRVLDRKGGSLSLRSIFIRIALTVLRLFIIMIPGPIIAVAFLVIGSEFFNPALSITLLVGVLLGMVYISFARYKNGRTRSATDYLSGTMVVKFPLVPFPD